LERKNQYQLAQRPKEKTEDFKQRIQKENEINRIKKPEYKANQHELVLWRKLATINNKPSSDIRHQVEILIKKQKFRTYDLFVRINESTLSQKELQKIKTYLLNIRIKSFQREYNKIKNLSNINQAVLKSLEYVISQIPNYFAEAQKQAHKEKVSSARITLDMASSFSKSAFLQNAL
jgi:hypothetical protein